MWLGAVPFQNGPPPGGGEGAHARPMGFASPVRPLLGATGRDSSPANGGAARFRRAHGALDPNRAAPLAPCLGSAGSDAGTALASAVGRSAPPNDR